jgi:hypothetical protein
MYPNQRDVVGWGLSNLLAPVADPLQALGSLVAHPSFAGLGRLAESPFQGIAQAFGAHTAYNPSNPGNPQQPAMPQPPGAASYLPAPVPALGPNMGQAFGPGAHAIVSYMGIGADKFTATTPNSQITFQPEPQAPFIGNRLVVVSKTNGASTTGIQVTITSPLTVSGIPQTPAPQVPAPIEMFAPDVTYSALQIQIAAAGTAISITFTASALPTGSDTLPISAGLYGYWLK